MVLIDIENEVFEIVATELEQTYSGITVDGEYIDTPAEFPAVTIVEADNRVLERMRTTQIENAATLMYEVNVYSNKASGKKEEAKKIANTVDSAFAKLGFTRTFRDQVPNLQNASIYRIVLRYMATVDKDYWIYQNY